MKAAEPISLFIEAFLPWLTSDRSHPESSKYGQHYSVEEVTELFAPAQDTVDAVRAWLESAGVASESVTQSINNQWLQFDARSGDVEALLKTQYHFFEHSGFEKTSIACDE